MENIHLNANTWKVGNDKPNLWLDRLPAAHVGVRFLALGVYSKYLTKKLNLKKLNPSDQTCMTSSLAIFNVCNFILMEIEMLVMS